MPATIIREKLLIIALTAGSLYVGSLGLYELAAKSAHLPGGPFPGYYEAERAEELTGWDPHTGLGLVDHLLHEEQEAGLYYRELLAGLGPGTQASLLDIGQ